tara:strand:- start:1609 stop:2409 length:801 start_codon:yes stop_codon:yes gene_type:complete
MKSYKKKYTAVRRDLYEEAYKTELELGINLSSFIYAPYTKLKFHYSMELASFFIFLLLKTNIRPNTLSLFYSFLGLMGVILFYIDSTVATLIALFIFFSKVIVDWMDGHIARLTNQTSKLGAYLDDWGALVTNTCFQIGISIYLTRITGNYNYYLIALAMVTLSAIDLRNYIFQNSSQKQNLLSERLKQKETTNIKINKLFNVFAKVFSIVRYDGRSRYTDFVILIILFELYFNQVFLSFIFPWLWMSLNIIKFIYSIKTSFDDTK